MSKTSSVAFAVIVLVLAILAYLIFARDCLYRERMAAYAAGLQEVQINGYMKHSKYANNQSQE